jgi:hypothetical protein
MTILPTKMFLESVPGAASRRRVGSLPIGARLEQKMGEVQGFPLLGAPREMRIVASLNVRVCAADDDGRVASQVPGKLRGRSSAGV